MLVQVFATFLLLTASLLGIYGQSLTYFLQTLFPTLNLLTILTVITVLSITIFVITPMLTYRTKRMSHNARNIYTTISIFIGIFVSLWSFIVLVAWYG